MRLAFSGALAALAVAVIVVASGGSAIGFGSGSASGGATYARSGASPAGAATAATALPRECPSFPGGAAAWYGADLPVAVNASLQSACPFTPDQSSLSFLSNASGSGTRLEFTVGLPHGGTNPATVLDSFGLGMWVSGIPCSYDGASFLNVQLEPPYHYGGTNGSANWTVQAPVDDLVPVGSCDPLCQNSTAFYTIEGVAYCEDDAAIAGIGAPAARGSGDFAPGDQLTVTFVGAPGAGGANPLTVYLNDTTNPLRDLSWSYGPSTTVDHASLAPYASAAGWYPTGWGYGVDVQATVQNCPIGGAAWAAACNSYDTAAWNATAAPTIVAATWWNATTLTYANGYDWTRPASSTAACARTGCADFQTFGGTGAYPYWSLEAWGGSAWQYSPEPFAALQTWGGASQYGPNGTAAPSPAPISAIGGVTRVGNTVYLDAIAADPNGIQAVEFGAYWCFTSTSPTVATAAATLTVSSVDTDRDGNWTAGFAIGAYSGSLNLWARAQSFSGNWSAVAYVTSTVTGVTACNMAAPAAPTFGAANVTAVGGGFALTWNDSSAAVLGYTIYVNATSTPTRDVVGVGNVSRAVLDLALPPSATNYSITVEAVNAAHLGATTTVLGVRPLTPLSATLLAPTSPYWVGSARPQFAEAASGGTAPYTYRLAFGDGLTNTTFGAVGLVTVTHDYGSYFGTAVASVTATDTSGETAVSAPVLITVFATPLAVPQAVAAGATAVNISWSLPLSPAGGVTAYTVFATTHASAASEMPAALFGGPAAAAVTVANTTNPWDQLTVPTGTTVWAEVIAWNGFGAGSLPANGTPLVATTANLTAGPILSSPPGGAAPFFDQLSDFVLNGTNDQITQASYAAGFNMSGPPTLTAGYGGTWVNATLEIASPGVHVVILHVADRFADFALQLVDVYVAAGGPLTVSLTAPGPAGWTGWAGTALTFRAQASGGPGPDTFSWAFGDGGVATGANATYTYPSPGNYTIVVTATDATTGGSGARAQTMTVFAPPTVAIQSRPGPNGSLSWAFTALTGGGSAPPSVTWSFGDGNVGSGAHVTHDYGAPGTYTVNVSAVDPTGKSASATLVLSLDSGTGSGGASGGFLGQSAGTWGGIALGLAALAIVLLLVLLVVARGRGGRRGGAIERWRSTDDGPRAGPGGGR